MVRHVTDDPVRAVTLAWRALPAPLRRWLAVAGPYGRAAALWGAGDRRGALTALEARPARLAAFSLAVDQPTVARSALARLSHDNPARPRLAARLAYREGRLSDAVTALDGASGWRAARLRRTLQAEIEMLEPGGSSLAPPRPRRRSRGRHARHPQGPRAAHRDRRAAVDQRRLHRQDPGDRARPAGGRARPARGHPDRLPGHGRRGRRQENRHRRRCALPPAAPVGHARPDGRPLRDPPAVRRQAHHGTEAGRAARRLQLRQRGHRARPPRRDPAPGRLRGAGVLGGHLAVAARRHQGPQAQRPLPADPGARDALHEVGRPGGDAGRGDARGDPRARRRPGQGDHRPQRRQRGIPPAAPRRPGKTKGEPRHQARRARRRPGLQPASPTRASARCSRRSRSSTTAASAPGR